jgi:hypothetical protein
MRSCSARVLVLLNFLIVCLAFILIENASAEPEVALRAEGYLGYSNIGDFVDLDGFQGGGTGSVSAIFAQFYLQGDVFADVIDFERNLEAKNVGPGVHAGWRDSELGSAGVVGSYNHLDLEFVTLDIYRTGFEGEIYVNAFTVGLNAGYMDLDGEGFAYLGGLFKFYPVERARLNFRIGAVGIDDDDPLVDLGLGGEYLMNDLLAPFVRWEASLPDSFDDVSQYSIVAGLTIYWGSDSPDLQTYDRGYLKSSCAGVLIFGRVC